MAHRHAPSRRVIWLLGATVLCYGVGYPLALLAHSPLGWVLVSLGGPLLLVLGVLVVRSLHRNSGASASSHERDAGSTR